MCPFCLSDICDAETHRKRYTRYILCGVNKPSSTGPIHVQWHGKTHDIDYEKIVKEKIKCLLD